MRTHKWSDLKSKMAPERQKKIRAQADEGMRALITMGLAELRKSAGMTQADLAAAASMSQSELSKAERRSDHLVSSLRRIVQGLGGELRVTAVFDGREI